MSLQVPNETDASSCENPGGGDEFCVMHLMVIGFHPRSGYRVEYCTPPLRQVGENGTTEEVSENVTRDIQLPEEWECIRYLALPDGAHNHDRGTMSFISKPPPFLVRTRYEFKFKGENTSLIR